jgi:hypothetical protein
MKYLMFSPRGDHFENEEILPNDDNVFDELRFYADYLGTSLGAVKHGIHVYQAKSQALYDEFVARKVGDD